MPRGSLNITVLRRFMPAVCLHKKAVKTKGGYSNLFRCFLKRALLGEAGMTTAGTVIKLTNGRSRILYARLSRVLADGEGLALFYQWRGAGGIRPCLRHWNVVSNGLEAGSDEFLSVFSCSMSAFRSYNKADLRTIAKTTSEAAAKYDAGDINKTRLQAIRKAAGFNCTSLGVLFDDDLAEVADFATAVTVDWVHTLLQDGVIHEEMNLIMDRARIPADRVADFLKLGWCFPAYLGRKASRLHEIFRDEATRVKCSCSEALCLYKLFRHYIETLPRNDALAPQYKSFSAACRLVDGILSFKRQTAEYSFDDLDRFAEEWMALHLAAYNESGLKPKSHWVFDIAHQLRRDGGRVYDCFIVERMHLRAKRFGNSLENTSRYERTLASAVYHHQVEALQQRGTAATLENVYGKLDVIPDCLVGGSARGDTSVSEGDVVFYAGNTKCGEVVACAQHQHDGSLFALVAPYEHVERVALHCSRWRMGGDCIDAPRLDDLSLASSWRHDAESDVTVIV